jgi:hypothetical protein
MTDETFFPDKTPKSFFSDFLRDYIKIRLLVGVFEGKGENLVAMKTS